MDTVITVANGKLSLKQFKNGTVLIGGGWPGVGNVEDNYTETKPENLIGNMMLACHAIPKLKNSRVARVWLGLEAETDDAMPIIGEIPNFNNAYVIGLSTHRYSNIYSVLGNFSGLITATGGISGDLTGDVTGTVSDISNHDTDTLSEGSTNLYFTDTRADARVAAATGANLDLSGKSTTDLSEGTNQYYTEARVQAKLDNAFAQLQAMLNNLATTTTLTLNLSGDPTPGDVTALNNSSLAGGTGYNTATAVATTSSGNGTGLTVNITASGGIITAVAINADGSGYAVGETITITGGGGNATIDVSAVVEMGSWRYSHWWHICLYCYLSWW